MLPDGEGISRRGFLRACVVGGCALPFAGALSSPAEAGPRVEYGGIFYEKEARFWKKGENGAVVCTLCPRECVVRDGARGYCGVRENRKGTYHTLVWGNPCALGVDPIEKKPLYHFLPGAKAFSLATAGCNMKCRFCQNWNISQARPEQTRNTDLPPAAIVEMAVEQKCKTIAFTYNEPVVFAEYVFDTAKLAQEKELRPLIVSNGFINAEPMAELCKVLSAVKIDLKGFTEEFYEKATEAQLKPVLETLLLLKKLGLWFEVVNLIIPTLNDKADDIRSMCKWMKKELGADVPLHFSAFYPMYKLRNLPRTPDETMFAAYDIARDEGLRYVYVGNVRPAGHKGEKTYCPGCGKVVIDRSAYVVSDVRMKDGKCAFCGTAIAGVWE